MRYFNLPRLVSIPLLLLGTVTSVATAALIPRQSSNLPPVPPSCTPVCEVFNTLQTNTDPSTLCTQTTSSGLQSCANCILLIGGDQVLNNDTLLTQTQRSVNAFVSACNAASFPIPGVLISDPTAQTTTTVTGTGSANSPVRTNSGSRLQITGSGLAAVLASLGTVVSLIQYT